MLSKLVSQIVVIGTPIIMVCLLIAFIGLFIYFNKRIDRQGEHYKDCVTYNKMTMDAVNRLTDRVNTLSDTTNILNELVCNGGSKQTHTDDRQIHIDNNEEDKIVVSEDEEDEEGENEEETSTDEDNTELIVEELVTDPITVTKIDHIDDDETELVLSADEVPVLAESEEIKETVVDSVVVDNDDTLSVAESISTNVIPEPQLEEICTNAVLKAKFLSTNYRGFKVNQLRDFITELFLLKDKEALKLKKSELITFLDKTYLHIQQ